MRYPLLFGTILAACLTGSAVYFATGFPAVQFLEEPFSVVANLPYVYPSFVVIGTLFGIGLAAFLLLAFKSVGHDTKRVRTLIITGLIAGITMILAPYDRAYPFFRWTHTLLAVLLAIITIALSYEFNKVERPEEKALAWLHKHLPSAMGIGTTGLFIISGINMLMETYFFILASAWILLVGLTVKRAKQ